MQTMSTWRSDGAEGPPDLHLFACGPFETDRTDDGLWLMPLAAGLVDPASEGQVWLASPDPTAPPQIDPGYLTHPRDADRLLSGIGEARRIRATEPLRSLAVGAEVFPGDDVAGDDLRRRLPQLAQTYHHPGRHLPDGHDPDDGAVVDADSRLHGIDGLMLAGASIMPRIPRANTNLPTMMLAEHLSARLTSQ